jgi:NADPH:quinone reductase-like Zn-dependent oxidoreductase
MGKETMKAVVIHAFGGNDVIEVKDMPMPSVRAGDVLVRVRAAGVNPVDWKTREGQTRIVIGSRFPKILGSECAGEVVQTGSLVVKCKPGDEVIATTGFRLGAYAEFAAIPVKTVFPKPHNMSFEEAAAIPIAGMTAYTALRDKGAVAAGKKVLINGASGGVGTFAVQIAKVYGADVTAVCSNANEALVKGLGADRVIDYHHHDFTQSGDRYDIIFDTVSSRAFGECKKVLTANGVYINTLPSLSIFRDILLTSLLPGKKAATMMVGFKAADMAWLCGQIGDGRIKVVLDKVFSLDESKEALAYSQTGRVRGKVVVKVS